MTVRPSSGSTAPAQGTLDFSDSALNRTILSLALPAVLEYVLFMTVRLTDTAIVGHLRDENALAAVGLAQSLIFLGNSPFFGLAVAATSLVARRWGEGDITGARRVATQFMGVAYLLALLTMAAGIVMARRLLLWMGAEPDVAGAGAVYMRIILLSSLMVFPLFVGNGILRGAGDTRTPMFNTGLMNAVNIVVSVFLAFGLGPAPRLDLAGVAWGTAAGNTAGALLMHRALMSRRRSIQYQPRHAFVWNRSDIQIIAKLAGPVTLERYIGSGSFVIFMSLVAILGTTAVAAHNIALRIEAIAYMPAIGLSFAITSLVGQAIGAGRRTTARVMVLRSLGAAGGVMLVLGVLFLTSAGPIVRLFGATPGVLAQAAVAVRVSVIELPFIAFAMILAGCLRGAGDTKTPMIIMVVCILVFRFVGVYTLGIRGGLGLAGVWLATAVDWAGRTGGMWLTFQRGRWAGGRLR